MLSLRLHLIIVYLFYNSGIKGIERCTAVMVIGPADRRALDGSRLPAHGQH